MLRVTPKCLFDLSGLQPDFTVRVVGRSFPAYRLLLVTQSDFFRKLLAGGFKESSLIEWTFIEGVPDLFALVLKTIQGEPFDLPDLQTAFSYLVYINYFQVKNIDSLQILRDLEVPPEQFMFFVEGLNKIFPEGFLPEIVEIIVSKTQPITDLSGLSPELRDAIVKSEEYIFPGHSPIFTQKMWELVQKHRNDPVKYYVDPRGDLVRHFGLAFAVRSLAEAFLKLRNHFYRRDLQAFPYPLIDLPERVTPSPSLNFPLPPEPRPTTLEEFRRDHDYFLEVEDALVDLGMNANTITFDDLERLLQEENEQKYEDYAFHEVPLL